MEKHFERAGGDECDWFGAYTALFLSWLLTLVIGILLLRYWINIVVDCTLGVATTYMLLQLSSRSA